VNHHGLDSSNNPLLIRSIRPRVAVMNNGDRKGCQPGTFRALTQAPSVEAIYQVHRNLRPDSEHNTLPKFIANTQGKKDCRANYIGLRVAADGRSYRVSVPSTGHVAKYSCR
ncbi:MAG: hypothetical protein OER86_13565, partial [Phycisphaerae bacterium]|nr:hypothetical protein [Phycisphaerae bacterium]